ncbi:MAG: AAA family ATPase [Chitinophagales bacterium]|nr:AAA family ATPase [Chitinophagales bacterium]
MDQLFDFHFSLLSKINTSFRRDFMDGIEWDERLIGIMGARGVGKTTFLLQHITEKYGKSRKCLYVSLDNISFNRGSLVSLADDFVKKGGECLVFDEIHKFETWSQELKNIYDQFPELHVIFTGSSVLQLNKGKADLSRRAVQYNLEGLSFREFLQIETKMKFEKYSLQDLLKNHISISSSITRKVKPYTYFEHYLRYGFYPYYLQGKSTYPSKLMSTVALMIEVDIPYLNQIELKYIHKMKKLLYLLAISVPFNPNMVKLAESLELSRNTVFQYMQYLRDADLINLLHASGAGYSMLQKPEKVYLHNSNLMYALSSQQRDTGSMRETFFYNQVSALHEVNATAKGDFLVDGKMVFEVGGKGKTAKQIRNVKNAYLAIDGIEHGYDNRIPLWLFGFLY